MPAPSEHSPSDSEVRAALRVLSDGIAEDILIDLADGSLDDDPAAKADAEELLRIDPKARAFFEQYRKGLAAWSDEEIEIVPHTEEAEAIAAIELPRPWLVTARERLRQFVAGTAHVPSAAADWSREEMAVAGAGLMALLGMRPALSAVRDRSAALADASTAERDPFEASFAILAERLKSRREVRVNFANEECELQLRREPAERAVLFARPRGALEWAPFALTVRTGSGGSATFSSDGRELRLTRVSDFPADFTSIEIHFR